MERTFKELKEGELREIGRLALVELERFMTKAGNPAGKYRCYRDRLIGICLVQGAAQHFIETRTVDRFDAEVDESQQKIDEKGFRVLRSGRVIRGVKDIDVFLFFRSHKSVPIPNRKHCKKTTIAALSHFGERSFDFMKKGVLDEAIRNTKKPGPSGFIREYVCRTAHGRNYLSKRLSFFRGKARLLY